MNKHLSAVCLVLKTCEGLFKILNIGHFTTLQNMITFFIHPVEFTEVNMLSQQ